MAVEGRLKTNPEARVCQVKCVSFYFLGDRFYLVTLLHDKLVKWQFLLRILTAFGSPGNISVNKVTRNGNAIFHEQCHQPLDIFFLLFHGCEDVIIIIP